MGSRATDTAAPGALPNKQWGVAHWGVWGGALGALLARGREASASCFTRAACVLQVLEPLHPASRASRAVRCWEL